MPRQQAINIIHRVGWRGHLELFSIDRGVQQIILKNQGVF